METSDFAAQVTNAARAVARLEAKRRGARKRLADLDALYGQAQRHLKMLVQAVEPYIPPTVQEIADAMRREGELP